MLPSFRSHFLDNICRELAARAKALRRHGQLTWETQQPDEFEWFTACFKPLVGHYCVFQFDEDNQVNVFVRSRDRRNRGKVLFQLLGIKVVDNAEFVVAAMEATIISSGGFETTNEPIAAGLVRSCWSRIEVRLDKDQP